MTQKLTLIKIKAELLLSHKVLSAPKRRDSQFPKLAYVGLDRRYTKFDIRSIAHKQRSKKARSDTITVREGGNLFYHMEGKLIRFKKNHDPINNSILFRNNIDLTSFEMTIPVFSPLTTKINTTGNMKRKAYHLRTAAPHKSKLDFEYTREYD